jgi:hypothetical protein
MKFRYLPSTGNNKRWAGYLKNQMNTGFGVFSLKLRNETTAFGYLEKPESNSSHFRVFGKTGIKELPPVPVTSKPSTKCQVS